ncbi:MAG: excinuclease ABC subunit UvrC [Verrucomicrobiales bacterium]|nr:excinuclease ABC subunit UvrC [Verrucomicrobiales bacterium]
MSGDFREFGWDTTTGRRPTAKALPWPAPRPIVSTVPVTELIRDKLSQVPHRPGIYLHKDRFGRVIYVGKARDLRKRVSTYFQPSRRLGWDLKFNALVEAIHDFDWHVVKSEAEALLLEGKLIKEFQPRFNIDFRDDKRFLLLKVNLNDPIPRFTLTRLRQDDGSVYFGPFAHSGSVRRTLTVLRRRFNLRGCRPLTPTEADYRHCLFGNLKYCTAPCIGNVPREQYLTQVKAACDFLAGQIDEMVVEFEGEMKKAAARLEFEKAAQLRDAIADLKRTTQRTEKFERIPYKLPVAINPEADLRELARVLNLPEPPSRIEGFDISNISGTFMVSSMVSFWHGRPDRSNYRRFKMKTVTQQDDFACMAETIRRRYARLLREVESGQSLRDGTDTAGEAPPEALQRAVDDVSGSFHDRPIRHDTDAAALRPDRVAKSASPEDEDVSVPEDSPSPELEAPWVPRPPNKPRLPDLILIDGGRGQLNAAVTELTRLGLGQIPVIGLAKEFEEIHRPGERDPLRLGLDSPAVKLLQRVRDEAHRFANTFNAQLRLKKISESLLDEFPGIGEARKQALLKKFGSVQRLKIATVQQIAEVPGFGGSMADKLHEFLRARAGAGPDT